MLNNDLMLSTFMFFISCMMFSFLYKHLLLTLISLEFMVINIIYNIYSTFMIIKINLFFIPIFMTLAVCEGVIGLSLLVYLTRLTGNDYIKSLNLMKW